MKSQSLGQSMFGNVKQAHEGAQDRSSKRLHKLGEPHWVSTFVEFFEMFPRTLWTVWKKRAAKAVQENHKRLFERPPKIWKTAGDEIVFHKRIEDPGEVYVALSVWLEAVESFKQEFPHIGVQCGLFGAGFPVTNSELLLEKYDDTPDFNSIPKIRNSYLLERWYEGTLGENDEDLSDGWRVSGRSNILREFLGPAVDAGFRLVELSNHRKMMLSLDVVYFLSQDGFVKADREVLELEDGFPVRYDGRVPLRGTWGGGFYPCFWLDMLDGAQVHETEDTIQFGTNRQLLSPAIEAFCEAYFKSEGNDMDLPFIVPTRKHLAGRTFSPLFVGFLKSQQAAYVSKFANYKKMLRAAAEQSGNQESKKAISPDDMGRALNPKKRE